MTDNKWRQRPFGVIWGVKPTGPSPDQTETPGHLGRELRRV